MKKEEYNLIKRLIFMASSAIIIVMFLSIFGHFLIKDNKSVKVINIDVNAYENKEYDNDSIILSYKLDTKEKIKFPILLLKTDNYIRQVWINDKKLTINENKTKKDFKIIKEFYTVNLPNNYADKTLKLKFEAKKLENKDVARTIKIMSESEFVLNQIRSNNIAFLMAMFLTILGIFLIIIYVAINTKTQRVKKLFWTGVIFLLISIAMMAQFEILELIVNSNRFIKNMKVTSIFLCIPVILMIAYNTFRNPKYKKIMFIYNIALYVIYAILRVLYNVNVISFDNVMIITKIIGVVTLVLLYIYNLASYKKVNVMEKIYTVGITLCYTECIGAILYSMIKPKNWIEYSLNIVLIGVFILFAVTIVYYAFIVEEYINKITEKKMLYAMAYTDSLTGIMNRLKYEEMIEELKNESIINKIIIMFDLNNLKKINDTKGHEAGDIYIKSFAKAICKVFNEYDFLGRIGGDEFLVILDKTNVDIEKNIMSINTVFKELISKQEYGYEASFAYGYIKSKENKLGIEELIKIADERMYENKVLQKAKEKV